MQKSVPHGTKALKIESTTSGGGLCCLRGFIDGDVIQQLNNIETADIAATVTTMEAHLINVANNGQNVPEPNTDVGNALTGAGFA